MKQVSIYLMNGIRTPRRSDGIVAYCLEYYGENRRYPHTLVKGERVEDMTGNRADLENLIRALRRMREKCILSIYTDSAYLNMGLGEERLVDRWKGNGWKSGRNTEVKNRDKWQEVLDLLEGTIYVIYFNRHHAYRGLLEEKVRGR